MGSKTVWTEVMRGVVILTRVKKDFCVVIEVVSIKNVFVMEIQIVTQMKLVANIYLTFSKHMLKSRYFNMFN